MKFSLSDDETSKIISKLEAYSSSLDSEYEKLISEIQGVAVRTNYNKLLKALRGIDDLYVDIVRGSLRKTLIDKWKNEGESLHSFSNQMFMGEESEIAAKKIEDFLEDIFISGSEDKFLKYDFIGEPNATREDFEEVSDYFSKFKNSIETICNDKKIEFDDLAEENEFYKFLIPVISSIGIAMSDFLSRAGDNIDILGDNFDVQMQQAKQTAEDAVDTIPQSDEALNDISGLFDDDFNKNNSSTSSISKSDKASSKSVSNKFVPANIGDVGESVVKSAMKSASEIGDKLSDKKDSAILAGAVTSGALAGIGAGIALTRKKNADEKKNTAKRMSGKSYAERKSVEASQAFAEFKDITKTIYKKILECMPKLPDEICVVIKNFSGIYKTFYEKYGDYLYDKYDYAVKNGEISDFTDVQSLNDRHRDYVKDEFLKVTKDRGNDKYFSEGGFETFISHGMSTYIVFEYVADMTKNVADAYLNKNAGDDNIMYALYVLFTPIMDGGISKDHEKDCERFCNDAVKKLSDMFGVPNSDFYTESASKNESDTDEISDYDDEEKINDLNKRIEKRISPQTISEVNDFVDKHNDDYEELLKRFFDYINKEYNENKGDNKTTEFISDNSENIIHNNESKKKNSKYGRYNVTSKAIDLTKNAFSKIESPVWEANVYYNDMHKNYGKTVDKLSNVLSFVSECATGGKDIGFYNETSKYSIIGKISGKVSEMLKTLRGKSVCKKLSNSFWNGISSRLSSELDNIYGIYLLERNAVDNGFAVPEDSNYIFFHNVMSKIDNLKYRKKLDLAIISADIELKKIINSYNESGILNELSPVKQHEYNSGLYFILVRAALVNCKEIDDETANSLVDKMYDICVEIYGSDPNTKNSVEFYLTKK